MSMTSKARRDRKASIRKKNGKHSRNMATHRYNVARAELREKLRTGGLL